MRRNQKTQFKRVKIQLETTDGNQHLLYLSAREVLLIIGSVSIVTDLQCCDGLAMEGTPHVIDCFTHHMNTIEQLAEPEQVHQLFHRIRDFFNDRVEV